MVQRIVCAYNSAHVACGLAPRYWLVRLRTLRNSSMKSHHLCSAGQEAAAGTRCAVGSRLCPHPPLRQTVSSLVPRAHTHPCERSQPRATHCLVTRTAHQEARRRSLLARYPGSSLLSASAQRHHGSHAQQGVHPALREEGDAHPDGASWAAAARAAGPCHAVGDLLRLGNVAWQPLPPARGAASPAMCANDSGVGDGSERRVRA